jgi:uncharacterized membrane protein YsdA (DUF1294 family)
MMIIAVVAIWNAVAFVVMWMDKVKARNGARRISEQTLFTMALFLGALGIWAGMYAFRHKTRQISFVAGIPVILILNMLCAYFLRS